MIEKEQQEPIDDAQDERVLTVRVPVAQYRTVRTVAVTQDMANAEVIIWAIELLERYVAGGGAR